MKLPLLLIAAICLISCCVATAKTPNGAEDAHKDILAGHIQLMEAGTIEIYTPGVDHNDPRFKNVPRKRLPSGCTNPGAIDSLNYAESYNPVMVAYILKHPESAKKDATTKP